MGRGGGGGGHCFISHPTMGSVSVNTTESGHETEKEDYCQVPGAT